MRSEAARSIVRSQVCLYGGLLIAICLKTRGLAVNSGISYYGIFMRTVIPYALGLLGSAFFCLQAAKCIEDKNLRLLKRSLLAIAVFGVIIVITPYSVDALTDWLHTIAGSLLFITQLLLSGWLSVKLDYKPPVLGLLCLEFAAGVLCAIYLTPTHGFLIQCQVIFQVAFGALLIYFLTIPHSLVLTGPDNKNITHGKSWVIE